MLRVPIISLENITEEEFKKRLSKYLPSSPPKFEIGEVVLIDSIVKNGAPALVTGVFSSHTSGGAYEWKYSIISFSEYDGSEKINSHYTEQLLRKV